MTDIGTFTPENLISGDKSTPTIGVRILAGILLAGAVLGKKDTTTPSTGTANGGNTGDGTMTLVESRTKLKAGVYTITCIEAITDGGLFSVVDPDGISLADASVAVAYENDQLTFLLNDGAADYVVGDSFTLTVAIGANDCLISAKGASDGTEDPVYILSEDVDASSEVKSAIAYKEGQFNERALSYGADTDIEDVRAPLAQLGIHAESSVPAGS